MIRIERSSHYFAVLPAFICTGIEDGCCPSPFRQNNRTHIRQEYGFEDLVGRALEQNRKGARGHNASRLAGVSHGKYFAVRLGVPDVTAPTARCL